MTSPKSKEQVVPEDILQTATEVVERIGTTHIWKGDCVADVALAILAERERDQWQPIDKAPEGIIILTCGQAKNGYFVTDAIRQGSDWFLFDPADDSYSVDFGPPTHFMPLPTPPKGGEE